MSNYYLRETLSIYFKALLIYDYNRSGIVLTYGSLFAFDSCQANDSC
jgi:hypothetical protein